MSNRLDVVTVCPSKPAIFRVVADALVTAIGSRLEKTGKCLLVLSGGSTPRGLHELLCTDEYRDKIDWTKVHLFWGDERTVPADHADSNFLMAKESLLDPLQIPASNIHRVATELGDWDKAAAAYQQTIADVTGADASGAPPVLDIILLGMGDDGHTASLFPSTTALAERKAWVVANHVPQQNTHRITMTVPLINAANHVWFMAAGTNKAHRLAEVLLGPKQPERLPSQLICPAQGELRWFVDESAAAELSSTP